MRDVYVRLEPRTRSDSIEPGIAARIHDPAWTLGRQWVLGELDGDDAGTPVSASVQIESHALSRVGWGNHTERYDPAAMPLDALLERTPVHGAAEWTLRQRVDAGMALVRSLRAKGLTSAITEAVSDYRLRGLPAAVGATQPGASALHRLAYGRIPDGQDLYRALRAGTSTLNWQGEAQRILTAWATALDTQYSEPAAATPSAWNKARMEYACRVQATGWSDGLRASEHRGARMDWYSFDLEANAATAGAPTSTATLTAVPAPIRFPGMPEARYWAFENARVDLGSVEATSTDLARMAVVQFAFAYGNDAFLIPVNLPVGAVSRVVTLSVSDTFSLPAANIPRANRGRQANRDAWSFLTYSGAGGAPSDMLLVPPVARFALRGGALEDVTLFRDEMANVVWAVERRIEGENGRSLDRAQALDRGRPSNFAPPNTGQWRYRLQTQVPEHWFPLSVVAGTPRMLSLAVLAPSSAPPLGHLLPAPAATGQIFEEEVPREGVRLTRADVVTRWLNGSTVVWRRHERAVGRGEGSSGLAFDGTEHSA